MGAFLNQATVTSVGVLGFDVPESRLINNVLRISACRPQGGYELCPESDIANCDVLIVNADDASSISSLDSLSGKQNVPVKLLVFSEAPEQPVTANYYLRPLSPVKLLGLLDRLVFDRQLLEPANQIFSGKNIADTISADRQDQLMESSKIKGYPKFRRALVVDDSPTVRKQLELELKASNIHVDSAETGEMGLSLVEQNSYDLIFLDVMLPGADGYQVCKHIKKDPRFKQTPVVMLTSKSSRFDRVRGSLAGCDTYLTKPVDYEEFKQVLDRF